MAVTPLTLPANWFVGTLTNIVAYAQTLDTINTKSIIPFVASCQDVNVENGDGKLVIATDIMSVNDLNINNSTLLSATGDPTLDEQYIPVENFKYIELRLNKYLMRGAFADEYAMSTLIGYLQGVMEKSKDIFLYQSILTELQDYSPAQPTQTISVAMKDIETTDTAQETLAKQTLNSNNLYKAMINVLTEMSAPTTKYNDIQYTECIDFDRLKLVVNSKFNTDMITDTLATLLNSNKITEALKWGQTFVIPKGQFEADNQENVIGWLMDNKKVQFGYFYNVGTAFFDASTLNDKYYLHFSYYMSTIKALPAVKFIATTEE